MNNLPTPKLGNVSAITITSPDLEMSLAFYQKLGFTEMTRMDFPFPWILITDGTLLIMLRKDDAPYIALTYYVADVDTLVKDLEQDGIVFTTKPHPNEMVKRCLMTSPDGMNVSFVQMPDGLKQPEGRTLLNTPPDQMFDADKYTNKACGLFGEFAHPVADIDASMVFWQKLGFAIISRMTSPYNWAIISDGLSIVGIHQTANFNQPTMTFFAADMEAKIEALKAKGVTGFAEKGGSNTTITTPEEQKINLFKLGM
jgi:predicted lactoylglutathione lyase